ncbi:hypothetical protein Tco_0635896 [Tanacetum coccineum]
MLTIGRLVNGSPCGGIYMVIKDLDLEPKIDAMMRDFLEELNGIPVAVVARFRVISKSTNRIRSPSGDENGVMKQIGQEDKIDYKKANIWN